MPYVNKPRPYKKEYEQEKLRGEHPDRMERQRARRAMDKTGTDANGKPTPATIRLVLLRANDDYVGLLGLMNGWTRRRHRAANYARPKRAKPSSW